MLKRLTRLFVYSNIFISFCAVMMVWQTYQLVIQQPVSTDLLAFVFFASLTSYSFHWHLTSSSKIPSERIDWTNRNRIIHTILFFAGIAGAAIFFFLLVSYWFWLALSAFITFLYSAPKIPHPFFRALRKIAIGKTIFLAFVWMYVTSVLPVIIAGIPWRPDIIFFCAGRFFLIYAICILFDYRDREDDKAAGIRSMVTYFGEKGIVSLFAISMTAFFVFCVLLLFAGYSVKAVIFLLLPGLIAVFLFSYAKRTISDFFYYLLLDGLMMFSALLMIVFGI